MNNNKVMTRQSGREVVLKKVYDKMNLLIEDMLKEKELETTEFVNAVIEEAEGLDEQRMDAVGETGESDLDGLGDLDLRELDTNSTVDISDSGMIKKWSSWIPFILIFQMMTSKTLQLTSLHRPQG